MQTTTMSPRAVKDVSSEREKVDTTTIALRLSGDWLNLWNNLRAARDDLSSTQLIREALKLRLLLSTRDSVGDLVRAKISFVNEAGEEEEHDLRHYLGISS
jgi:hypothetical protein